MKNNIFKILILIGTLISSFTLVCQNYNSNSGYHFIEKAQKAFENDKLAKAEKFLNKAEKSDYGFCGNAWAGASSSIQLLRARIEIKREKYDSALEVLDQMNGCGLGANCSERDRLKIITLFEKFGKEEVIKSFEEIESFNSNFESYDESYEVYLKDLDYTFTFGGSTNTLFDKNGVELKFKPSNNEFILIARNYSFYTLLWQDFETR